MLSTVTHQTGLVSGGPSRGPNSYDCVYELRQKLRCACCNVNWFKPPVIHYWSFRGGVSVVVYSNCQCLSAFFLSLAYCSIYLGQPCGHLLGKICPLDFSLVLFLF